MSATEPAGKRLAIKGPTGVSGSPSLKVLIE